LPGLYLYCLTPPENIGGLELAGVGGNLVTPLRIGPFHAWTHCAEGSPAATVEAIREHHEVVRATWQHTSACVPARFGQWFATEPALEADLLRREAALSDALVRVRGAGEHGVRLSELAPPAEEPSLPAPATGRAYLEAARLKERAREERVERGERIASVVLDALGSTVRAQRVSALPAEQGLVSLSHLVPSERASEYAEALERFRGSHEELSLISVGPWPAYSFAE
jgi:hypothetical protein